MDFGIKAACYYLGISDEESAIYSFIHSRVLRLGGRQEFLDKRDAIRQEVESLGPLASPGAVFDFVDSVTDDPELRDSLDAKVVEVSYETTDYLTSIVGLLSDSELLQRHLDVYEKTVLPRWRAISQEEVDAALREIFRK